MAVSRPALVARASTVWRVTKSTASARVYGSGTGIQRWMPSSWQARNTSSTSAGRYGRSTSRSVRTTSVVRSTSARSMAMALRVAEDAVDGDLDDHPRRVHPGLAVALGVAALGLADGLVVV